MGNLIQFLHGLNSFKSFWFSKPASKMSMWAYTCTAHNPSQFPCLLWWVTSFFEQINRDLLPLITLFLHLVVHLSSTLSIPYYNSLCRYLVVSGLFSLSPLGVLPFRPKGSCFHKSWGSISQTHFCCFCSWCLAVLQCLLVTWSF